MLQLDEKALQTRCGNVGLYIRREDALARFHDGLIIQVGREDLQRKAPGGRDLCRSLHEEDGQRIGLLTRGAGGHPRAQRAIRGVVTQQHGHDLGLQLCPHLRVAEEARHPYQQLTEQEFHLLRVALQKADVVGEIGDLVQPSAPIDAATDRALLVE